VEFFFPLREEKHQFLRDQRFLSKVNDNNDNDDCGDNDDDGDDEDNISDEKKPTN
jgi:hypothetical protein